MATERLVQIKQKGKIKLYNARGVPKEVPVACIEQGLVTGIVFSIRRERFSF